MTSTLTPVRMSRLFRFVQFLGSGPKTRAALLKKLKVDTRGFYRDFEQLRLFGVAVELHAGRYVLIESVEKALGRLPLPDPRLSVQEAIILARGKTATHRKFRDRLTGLLGKSV